MEFRTGMIIDISLYTELVFKIGSDKFFSIRFLRLCPKQRGVLAYDAPECRYRHERITRPALTSRWGVAKMCASVGVAKYACRITRGAERILHPEVLSPLATIDRVGGTISGGELPENLAGVR